MTKKHFIALADAIKEHNSGCANELFTENQIRSLADFCKSQNQNFNGVRWFSYIKGECGKNGGKIK